MFRLAVIVSNLNTTMTELICCDVSALLCFDLNYALRLCGVVVVVERIQRGCGVHRARRRGQGMQR